MLVDLLAKVQWLHSRKPLTMTQMTFIDLFAGCGGLSLGLSLAGHRGLFAIEKDEMAFLTFQANFRSESPYKFDWPDWLEERAWNIDALLKKQMDNLASLRDQVTVIAGGPPCQGFSFAGRREADDPRNQLFKKYVRMVHTIRPKALILENVPGMRVAHATDEKQASSTRKRRSFLDKLLARLEIIGYRCTSKILDASDFGVPQRRPRLIVIGVREDIAQNLDGGPERFFDILERDRKSELASLGLSAPVSARDAISDLETRPSLLEPCRDPESRGRFFEKEYGGPRTAFQQLMHLGHQGRMDSMRLARHREEVQARFQQILDTCPRGVRMNEEHRASFKLLKHRIYPMAARAPAPTITTLPDDVLHYSEPRILTVRESARLQSFPDWFVFRGKFTTGGQRRTKECPRYTQVGNAVPPLLARALGLAITAMLHEADQRLVEEPRRHMMAPLQQD